MSRPNMARSYEDFQPSFDWKQEDGSDILVVNLPGFKKEQLKVQLNNLGKLTVNGERPVGSNKWSRFRKDFQVPENSNVNEIRARYENGALYVTMPKLAARARKQAQPVTGKEPMEGPKTADRPKPTKDLQGDASTVDAEKKSNGKTSDAMMEKRPSGKSKVFEEVDLGPGKTTNGPMDAGKRTDVTKEKEEEKKPIDAPKTADGSTEAEPSTWRYMPESWKRGGGSYVYGLNRPKKMVVGVVVAIVALVALGIYVAFNLRSQEENGN
ncbi:inactive protein RESTRICTED TEV MOVEMENT 2-like [Magnolia sinica]|uniref:inactive protein RESTRICTED TEV MOVEMENT 2-like n=1 Tax=Magnolia sinica TaxID=86752 RepID=UPI002659A3E4|nr:inactive protein RESTRICTED TEV MOVEMENT 2-like [Magnolia sinica]